MRRETSNIPQGKTPRNFVKLFFSIFFLFLFFTFFLPQSQISFVSPVKATTANWYDTNWKIRRVIAIDNSGNSSALNNYQIKISFPSLNFDFSKAESNGADIRFTDDDGTTLLNYWIESYDSVLQTGTIWVKVPLVSANSTKTIYMYYGNSSVSTASSGDNTFDFFDDFTIPSWTSLSNMPYVTSDESASLVNGKFYLIGGYGNTAADVLSTVYEYDPASNSYALKTSMPTARWGNISVALNNKIYVFGGATNQAGAGTVKNEVYDPSQNTWTTKADLPVAIGGQGITGCTDGTKIYLFFNSLSYEYDPVADGYTQKQNIPTVITNWSTCAYYSGNIYIIGGWQGSAKNYVQIYNIAGDSWTSGTAAPFAFYGAIRENPIIGDKIYIIGGQNANGEFNAKVYVYDITNNSWSEKSFGPYAADGVAGGVYNNKIYSFGGRQDVTGPYGLNFASVYTPSLDDTAKWHQLTGNFTVNNGTLRRNVPALGTISQVKRPEIRTEDYQSSSSFILETSVQLENTDHFNSIAIHANDGIYASNLNGYLAPYIDFGANSTNIYRETGGSFTNLNSTSAPTVGTFRYKIISTDSNISVFKDDAEHLTSNDTTYRNGYIQIIEYPNNIASWNWIFVRKYSTMEPTTSVGTENNQSVNMNLNNDPTGVSNGRTRITGNANTGNSSYTINDIQYSVNGGGWNGATATDGGFNSPSEDFYLDFNPQDNNYNQDGYTVRVKAQSSSGVWQDNLFYFQPFNLDSPANNSFTTNSLPTFSFTVNKGRFQDLKDNLSKFQVLINKDNKGWQVYIDNIPVVSNDTNGNGTFENNKISVNYSNNNSSISVHAKEDEYKLSSGSYQWKIVAVDKANHSQETETRKLRINIKQFNQSKIWFPLTIDFISGIGTLDLSTIHPQNIKNQYLTPFFEPVIKGIALSGSTVSLTAESAGISKIYTTVTGMDSRFAITLPDDFSFISRNYTITLSVKDYEDNYNELPIFSLETGTIEEWTSGIQEVTKAPLSTVKIERNKQSVTKQKQNPPQKRKNCFLFICW